MEEPGAGYESPQVLQFPIYCHVLASSSAEAEESLHIYYNSLRFKIYFPGFLGLWVGGPVTISEYLFILLSEREIDDCRCLENFIWFEFRDPSPRYLAWQSLAGTVVCNWEPQFPSKPWKVVWYNPIKTELFLPPPLTGDSPSRSSADCDPRLSFDTAQLFNLRSNFRENVALWERAVRKYVD